MEKGLISHHQSHHMRAEALDCLKGALARWKHTSEEKLTLSTENYQGPSVILQGPRQSLLNVNGKILVTQKCGEKAISQEVYVADDLGTALLGHLAIAALGLIRRIEPVSMD